LPHTEATGYGENGKPHAPWQKSGGGSYLNIPEMALNGLNLSSSEDKINNLCCHHKKPEIVGVN
jgi:hypothetical protein